MRIQVLFFASLRDLVGSDRVQLELPESTRVEQAAAVLVERYPRLRPALAALRFAVNEEFVEPATILAAGDTLALIPPVSGG